MNIFKRIKESNRKQRETYLTDMYQLKESNGALYVVCGDMPVHMFSGEETIENAVKKLGECREVAIAYEEDID